VKEYQDKVIIIHIPEEEVLGTVEQYGAFVSLVKYKKDGMEYEVFLENEEFVIVNELLFEHFEEEN
jgi:hypothetical protein